MIAKSKIPKIAVFYDWLNQWGGAEKVLLDILSIYPDATVFTLVHNPSATSWLPRKTKIITSLLNQFPLSAENPLIYTPIYDLILEQFDFSQYDIVISTTSTIGHCLLTGTNTLFICYYHNINRYLYQTPKQYHLLKPLLTTYSFFDQVYANRPDNIFCNSKTVFDRIQKHYHKTATIIHPGINTNFFKPAGHSDNSHFLIVSRMVAHKNIDIVINAFKKLPYKLTVIGTGRNQPYLRYLANDNPNIKFLGNVGQNELLNHYQNCIALICPQIEDFGLTPIEAQACGKPVVALGIGGNTETINNNVTGIFFDNATSKSVTDCISKFMNNKYSEASCRRNSLRFSRQKFMLNFKQAVDNLWLKHLTTIS